MRYYSLDECLSLGDYAYIEINGMFWCVDGLGVGWFVTSGFVGLPPTSTQTFDFCLEAIDSLPDDIRLQEAWEEQEGE